MSDQRSRLILLSHRTWTAASYPKTARATAQWSEGRPKVQQQRSSQVCPTEIQ